MVLDAREWMPGATHLPLPASMDGKNWSSKRRGRQDGAILHTAASNGTGKDHSIYWSRDAVGASCHFYIDKDGTTTQLVARSQTAWTSVQGSNRTIGIETQGHPSEAWTAAQIASLARVLAWASNIEGWPLQAMSDRRTGTKGVGYHDQGGGGESWNPNAHYCPGALRVAQIPQVINQSKGKGSPDMTPDQAKKLDTMNYAIGNIILPVLSRLDLARVKLSAESAAQTAALSQLASQQGIDPAAINAAITSAVEAAMKDVEITLSTAKAIK